MPSCTEAPIKCASNPATSMNRKISITPPAAANLACKLLLLISNLHFTKFKMSQACLVPIAYSASHQSAKELAIDFGDGYTSGTSRSRKLPN